MIGHSRWFSTISAAAGLILLLGCEARVDTGQNPIYVPIYRHDLKLTVFDDNSRPLAGATVRLYRKAGDGALFLTSEDTDKNGVVTFPQPDVGDYLVSGSKDGYVGASSFVKVVDGAVVVSDLTLVPITSPLLDAAQGPVTPLSGGRIITQPVQGISQSSVTFPPGSVSAESRVTIVSLVGQQIPVTPPSQVALSAVNVSVTGGSLTDTVQISLGLPFTLNEGDVVPIFGFDPATNSWKKLADGVVTGGNVVADIANIGSLSALATFIPRRTLLVPDIEISERPLTADDGPIVSITWIPRLGFPASTNYDDKTKNWIRGTIEQIIGLKFGEEVTTKITREPSATQTLSVLRRVDLYTITVQIGSSKPAREAKTLDNYDFFGEATTQSAEVRSIEHNSGFGGGG